VTQHPPCKKSKSAPQNAGSRTAGHTSRHKVRKISTKKTDPAVETLQKEVEIRKKFTKLERRAARNPNGGVNASSYRQPVATRHTALSAYSGVSSAPLSSRGPHPANYGNRSSFAQPPNKYGNRNGNFYRAPNSNPGCFNCGDPTHRVRNCPVSSAEHPRLKQQSAPTPRPSTQRHLDVKPAEKVQETEVHSTKEASEIVQSHKTLERGAAPSITEDPTSIRVDEDLQEYEGVEPRMWSTAEVADAAQRDGDRKGATGPYTPSFSANERLEDRDRETEEVVWTTGEVQFESVESADGPTNPFPILGVKAESIDELANPSPTAIQLERNQPDLSPDWTDEERNPTGAELMETKEEAEVELENEDELVADHRDKSACSLPDLGRSQRSDNIGDEVKVAEVLQDVRTDHPTSTPEVWCNHEEMGSKVS